MGIHKLILVRHGQSQWNEKNLFTGWVDPHLGPIGIKEAQYAGQLLKQSGLKPTVVYTSKLSRAIQTANIVLDITDLLYLDTHRSWQLNERHYGALQGRNKEDVLAEYGRDQLMVWRRSYDVPPPPIAADSPYSQLTDPRYADLPKDAIPLTESLKQVLARVLPYWEAHIAKDLQAGRDVIVFAHGTVMRALVKHIDGVSEEGIAKINIPTGIPLVYELDDELKAVKPGYYLDVEAAAIGIARAARITPEKA